MNYIGQSQKQEDKARVRRNAGSAAIAAVLMLYFGFERLSEPTGTDLFSKANLVFFYTVRFGGIAMAILAGWSWTGHATALIVDAFVSIGIGALLALTGICMVLDGGDMFQTVLNVVFGWMFYAAGVNNWSTYQEIQSSRSNNDIFPARSHERMSVVTSVERLSSTHGEIQHQESIPLTESTPHVEPVADTPVEVEAPTEIEKPTVAEDPPAIEESTGGYLASFANKKDPPQE